MNQGDLESELSQFKRILTARPPTLVRFPAANGLIQALREIFASVSACAIFSSLSYLGSEELEHARETTIEDQAKCRPVLPSVETIEEATPRLLQGMAESDTIKIVAALRESGILQLCLPPSRLLDRLELSASSVMRMSQVFPLIELALIAMNFNALEKAARYAARARSLEPGAPELHELYTIEGVIALSEGNKTLAKECLAESAHVCERNYRACLSCSVRSYNTVLAQKLFECGESAAVLDYLRRCKVIWRWGAGQIDSWIDAIENAQTPDFSPAGLNKASGSASIKITAMVIRSSFLHDQGSFERGPETPLHETQAELERMRSAYRDQTNSAIRGKLETSEN